MNDIIKIIKSLKDLGVLIDGVTEIVKHEKKKRRQIFWNFLSTCSHVISTACNFFSSKSGRGVRRAGRRYLHEKF